MSNKSEYKGNHNSRDRWPAPKGTTLVLARGFHFQGESEGFNGNHTKAG